MSQKNNPNFSIIIPNYNGAIFLSNCLTSLITAIKKCPNSYFEIILVDNHSHDNSLELVKKFFNKNKLPNLKSTIYYLPSNLGFAGAVNYGINQSQYEYSCLCNNDLILESNWFKIISKKIKLSTNPKIVTYFGTVLNFEGTKFESQGFKFYPEGRVENISNGQPFFKKNFNIKKDSHNEFGANASLIVYRKQIIQKIGLFDESFFAYLEDVDIALRLNKIDYQTLYIPQAISYHLGGGTSKQMKNIRSRLCYRNWFFIIIKNYSLKNIFQNFFRIILERSKNLFYFFKETYTVYHWKTFFIFPYDFFKTHIEILYHFPKMIQKRHQTKKLLKSIKST